MSARARPVSFNRLKRRALAVLAKHGWMRPPVWAFAADFHPPRAAYTYLLRLHRWGLLRRRLGFDGRIEYAISPKGTRRLSWLKRMPSSAGERFRR